MILSNKPSKCVTARRWRCMKCSKEISLKGGTSFEDSKLPFGQGLLLIYCSVHRFTYEEAMHEARMGDMTLSPSTIANWYEIYRDTCVDWAERWVNLGKLGGEGSVVEIDESLIGHRKNHRGRIVSGTWILGIVDVHTGDLRIEIFPGNRRDSRTLLELITKHVNPKTTVMTDC